jgi:hypothetical protein
MNLNFSQILDQILNNYPLLILFGLTIILFIWNIFLQIQNHKTKKRIEVLFKGKKAVDLEGLISEAIERMEKSEENIQEIYKFLKHLDKTTKKSLQKVGVVRFNPFHESGGDQSFAVALLDAYDNGFIISSLYTRQGVSVYSKPIEKGESKKYPLSEEEKKALKKAQK